MNIERWGWYSIGVNVFLTLLHGLIAIASGSLAVAAELVHNTVDLLTAVAVLVGLKLSMRESKAFPYGLYKVENLVAGGLAGMILLAAYEIARDAILAPEAPVVRVDAWMLAALLFTTAIPLVFSRFELRAGQAANSPALIADAKEYRVHVFTTGLAFIALLSDMLRLPFDSLAALLIVAAVAKTGWDLLRDAMRVLLDASVDPTTLRRVQEMIEGDPGVTEVKWITGRNAGRFRFIEAGVALRVVELGKVEAVIGRIETHVRSAVPHVERVLIHVEAASTPHVRYAVPLADHGGTISAHFGEAPLFALITQCSTGGEIEEQRIVSNPHRLTDKAKGIRVAEWLVAQKVDVVLIKEDLHRKGPEYVLRDAGSVIWQAKMATLAEALAYFQSHDLYREIGEANTRCLAAHGDVAPSSPAESLG